MFVKSWRKLSFAEYNNATSKRDTKNTQIENKKTRVKLQFSSILQEYIRWLSIESRFWKWDFNRCLKAAISYVRTNRVPISCGYGNEEALLSRKFGVGSWNREGVCAVRTYNKHSIIDSWTTTRRPKPNSITTWHHLARVGNGEASSEQQNDTPLHVTMNSLPVKQRWSWTWWVWIYSSNQSTTLCSMLWHFCILICYLYTDF